VFCACDLGFEIRAGFVLHLVVLSVDFVACFDEGGFQKIGCGGEFLVIPDVSLADLHGESAYVAEELCSQRGLGGGERWKLACVTFSGHFDHSEIHPQVEYCKNRCRDGEPNDCTLSYNFYAKGPFAS
jgi:hypothetical protein